MPGKPGPRSGPPEPWTVPGVSWPGRPGPWAVARAWWRVSGGAWAVAPGARSVGRWPCLVRPGARSVGRDPCALVRVPGGRAARLVRLVACALVRDPWRVRPGGPRPWRVRLVAWPTVPGPRPPVPGPRPPPPGPKNGPGRVLRGLLPDFTLSVVPKTVFRIPVSRETSPWKKGPL